MQHAQASDNSRNVSECRHYGSEAVLDIIEYTIKMGLAGQMWTTVQAD